MSSKSKKGPKLPSPRSMDEIQKDYQNVAFRAGQLQYQIYVEKAELEKLNERLVEVNQEAAQRQHLDSVLKTEQPKEVSSESQQP